MSSHEAKSKTVWIKSNWRLLAVIVAATLLIATFIAVVLTAPISELIIGLRNTEDTDTVRVVVYLDNSRVDSFFVGAGWADGLRLHVSPGTYAVGVDFAYDGQPDETIDFLWTTHVDFNGVNRNHLAVDRDGIGPDLLADFFATKTPIEQAVRDPNVMAPALTLGALHAILVTAIWDYRRHGPTAIKPGKAMEKE
jgi:hypothetical protein